MPVTPATNHLDAYNNLEVRLDEIYQRMQELQEAIAPGQAQSVWSELANLKDIVIELKGCVCDLVPSADLRAILDIPASNLPVLIDAQRCANARFVVGVSYWLAKQIGAIPTAIMSIMLKHNLLAVAVSGIIALIPGAQGPAILLAALAGIEAAIIQIVQDAFVLGEDDLPAKAQLVAALIQDIGDDAICAVYETTDADEAVIAIHALIDAQSAPQAIEDYTKALFRREIINFAYTSNDAEQSFFGRVTGVKDWSSFDCSSCVAPISPLLAPSACGSSSTDWIWGTPQLSDGDDFGGGGVVSSEWSGSAETFRFESSDELSVRIDSMSDDRLYSLIYNPCGASTSSQVDFVNADLPLVFRLTKFLLIYHDTFDIPQSAIEFDTTITIGIGE